MYEFELTRSQDIPKRLPLPFAILVATISLLSYLINERPNVITDVGELCFWLVLFASVATSATGTWFFRIAWFGHSDKLMAVPNAVENYYALLVDTYKDFENCDELVDLYFNQYLLTSYAEYGSHVADNNDKRIYSLYQGLCFYAAASAMAFVALFIHFLLTNGQ